MASKQQKKLIGFKKNIHFNAAILVVSMIFLYAMIMVILAVNKKTVTIYQVSTSNINNNIIVDGLAIREEQILFTPKSGYTCYYVRDGAKVKKGSTICTIDSSGKLYQTLEDSQNYDELLTPEDYQDIRAMITNFKSSYSDVRYFDTYNFESQANNKVIELTGELLFKEAENQGISLAIVTSPESGIITYYTDGYEDRTITEETIEDSLFSKDHYARKSLKSGESREAGNSVAKLVSNEEWHIYAKVTEEQLAAITNEDMYLRLRINHSSYTMYMPFSVMKKNGKSYIDIKLNRFMSNFVSERFLNVEIILAEDNGLKIPTSAIYKKDIYRIPKDYFVRDDDGDTTKELLIERTKEDGSKEKLTFPPTIYGEENGYVLCDPNVFHVRDIIINEQTGKTIAVALMDTSKLDGVFSTNHGIAEFKMVTVTKVIDEYSLIKSGEMVSSYDNIVLNSSEVEENQILY